MSVLFTKAAVEAVLGSIPVTVEFNERSKSFQLKLRDLGKLTDRQKIEYLIAADDALQQAGYNSKLQLAHASKTLKDDKGRTLWIGFPTIWVNPPESISVEAKEHKERADHLAVVLNKTLEVLAQFAPKEAVESLRAVQAELVPQTTVEPNMDPVSVSSEQGAQAGTDDIPF